MSPTQISPGTTGTPPTLNPPPEGGDIFDPSRWETVFREAHDYPNLVLLLQDDLTRSRKREAFWISVVVHMVVILLMVNSTRLMQLLPRRSVVMVSPEDLSRQKDLTYLELPPDAQKITKRPETDKISDKNRIAESKAPQLNREELKKAIGSLHPGPAAPSSPGPEQPQPQAQSSPAPQQQPSAPQRPPDQNQMAKLATPPVSPAKPNFNTGAMSAGSAIEQAARAAVANRGGYSGGDGGYGLGEGRQPKGVMGPLEVLSDTQGVDFGPYLQRVLHDVRENWYRVIPESAMMKKGKVTIEFAILKDGSVAGLKVDATSGDVSLDRAAWGGISGSNPFPPLPVEFSGQYLALRFRFYYNPGPGDIE
jgi:TonB family protein